MVKNCVLDTSAILSLLFEDEKAPITDILDEYIRNGGIFHAPNIIWYEIGNVLRNALKSNRITDASLRNILSGIGILMINTYSEPQGDDLSNIILLAHTHGLTVYDASYLELAMRLQIPIATLDREILKACSDLGVENL